MLKLTKLLKSTLSFACLNVYFPMVTFLFFDK